MKTKKELIAFAKDESYKPRGVFLFNIENGLPVCLNFNPIDGINHDIILRKGRAAGLTVEQTKQIFNETVTPERLEVERQKHLTAKAKQ